ncbi:hypothetical protein NGRA_0603 [Nosema granulosis]|uniref:Uncharacterized protein n=1 Tax=Nosema granulosis TaxID=83296 RepID=A0A9P6H1P4_9MICR|nr:hypothetical protein NGRA_0603 [Nosema granulosis]
MIFVLFLFKYLHARVGTLAPYKSSNLRLSIMADNSLRFIDPLKNNNKNDSDLVSIEPDKFRISLRDKPICKVDENEPLVSTCVDKVRFIDWAPTGEDGFWKFRTDNDYCLTAGGFDKKTKGYFVHAIKCDQNNINQKFKFTPISKKNTPLFADQIDEYGEGNILEFHKIVSDLTKDKPVLITVKDDTGDKHYRTTSKELNSLFAPGNQGKLMDHDFLVDRGINAPPLKNTNTIN